MDRCLSKQRAKSSNKQADKQKDEQTFEHTYWQTKRLIQRLLDFNIDETLKCDEPMYGNMDKQKTDMKSNSYLDYVMLIAKYS